MIKVIPKKKPKVIKKNDPRINVLRSLLRNLINFRILYESDNIDELRDQTGRSWSLWDLEDLYKVAVTTDSLPLRQRQAIELFLVQNLSEDRVAELMGIKKSNPCGMYASSGLVKLLKMMDDGSIPNLFTP